jgi:hypothetical protein
MTYHPPSMAPLTVYVNGERLDSASTASAEPGAPSTASPAPEPLRLDVTTAWLDGVPTPLPRQPLRTAPPEAPRESPVRTWYNGQLIEVPPPVEHEESPGETQMLDEMEQRALVLARAWDGAYKSPDQWRDLQQRENAYAARQYYRQREGRAFIHPFEERR